MRKSPHLSADSSINLTAHPRLLGEFYQFSFAIQLIFKLKANQRRVLVSKAAETDTDAATKPQFITTTRVHSIAEDDTTQHIPKSTQNATTPIFGFNKQRRKTTNLRLHFLVEFKNLKINPRKEGREIKNLKQRSPAPVTPHSTANPLLFLSSGKQTEPAIKPNGMRKQEPRIRTERKGNTRIGSKKSFWE